MISSNILSQLAHFVSVLCRMFSNSNRKSGLSNQNEAYLMPSKLREKQNKARKAKEEGRKESEKKKSRLLCHF